MAPTSRELTSPSIEALLVRRPGLQTTVQDLGRPGYGRYGVPSSGAMDALSLRLGNLLLDNPVGAAGLELTLVGPELEVLAPLVCAYVGADMGLVVGASRVAPGRTFIARTGEVIRFGAARLGTRAYLCVAGGIDVAPILGSRSTAVTANLGGWEGRPLLGGDVLRVEPMLGPPDEFAPRRLKQEWLPEYSREWVLRVVEGPQAVLMSETFDGLLAGSWRVGDRSNRVGVRLEGPRLPSDVPDFETEGVPLGAIQLPPDGAPILLLADRQMTGGYPKPAVLAAVDLPLAGQLRPGDSVRFRRISIPDALELLREREARLAEGVFETPASNPSSPLGELIRALEDSRVDELHLRSGGESFRWRRRRGR